MKEGFFFLSFPFFFFYTRKEIQKPILGIREKILECKGYHAKKVHYKVFFPEKLNKNIKHSSNLYRSPNIKQCQISLT